MDKDFVKRLFDQHGCFEASVIIGMAVAIVAVVSYALNYLAVALAQWALWHCGWQDAASPPTWAIALITMVVIPILAGVFRGGSKNG